MALAVEDAVFRQDINGTPIGEQEFNWYWKYRIFVYKSTIHYYSI